MVIGVGVPVFTGVAIGRIHLYQKQELSTKKRDSLLDKENEKERFLSARRMADKQLADLYEKVLAEVGEQEAMIIDVQRMMLDDADFYEAIISAIESGHSSAEEAVDKAGKQFAQFFASMDDDYMKARSADILDVSHRLLTVLNGWDANRIQLTQPSVVVAEDLTPSETVQMDKSKVLAFVIRQGSSHSHTAILARTLNIPTLVQTNIQISELLDGRQIIVDGCAGQFYIDPDGQTIDRMREKQQAAADARQQLEAMRGLESVTADGKRIELYANIGSVEDAQRALQNDAEGIGLFRSEFLFLGREDYPSEEEQFTAYRKVLSTMQGRRVIIRTMDIGADKKADYFGIEWEENPALGYRGVRISLDREELFKTQLRAIYRASAFGKTAVMFPMIISVKEVQRCKEIVRQVMQELKAQEIATGEVEVGVMIETPAAVMLSDELAQEVDFFSVGTNDLTQYTLAADRQNPRVEELYDARHPAVLKMLAIVADSARKAGIWAGICGELAGDMQLTETLLRMGFQELSVSPAHLLELRKKVRESTVE
ncbi:phosphoenolpyruvate--protein phosphotransferase [Oscillospiraceae bacterium PP1C4]